MVDIDNKLNEFKEVDVYEDNDGYVDCYGDIIRTTYSCPNCHQNLIRYENICPKCGQLLRW